GAVYAWELRTLQRVQEHVEKGVEFHAMCLDWGKGWAKHSYNLLHNGGNGAAGGSRTGSAGAERPPPVGAPLPADGLALCPAAAAGPNLHNDELALERISITHLIRDPLRQIILAGTSTGYILIFRWPFKIRTRDAMELALAGAGGGGGASGGASAGGAAAGIS